MITRFAPAPTGFLHLGHVVNALHVWGPRSDRDGRVLLRIEDHDRQRCRPNTRPRLLEDLAWLGFRADGPLVRQSERDAIYRKALQPLIDRELVYGCTCTSALLRRGRRWAFSELGGEAWRSRAPARARTALPEHLPRSRHPADRRRGVARADRAGRRALLR